VTIEILDVLDVGDDVLLVHARAGEDEVRAVGWVSATTNHYDDDSLDRETGHRRDDATPRPLTREELLAYAERLVLEQHPGVREPVSLLE
jgi:hypothetical protein